MCYGGDEFEGMKNGVCVWGSVCCAGKNSLVDVCGGNGCVCVCVCVCLCDECGGGVCEKLKVRLSRDGMVWYGMFEFVV